MPVTSALAANFAPADMRGRYMAVFGLTWAIPATIAPTAAGVILDNYNPNLLWYIGGALCLVSTVSFYALHLILGKQKRFQNVSEEEDALNRLSHDPFRPCEEDFYENKERDRSGLVAEIYGIAACQIWQVHPVGKFPKICSILRRLVQSTGMWHG